jgi:peptidyl-prolyl cis-trans isomerase C
MGAAATFLIFASAIDVLATVDGATVTRQDFLYASEALGSRAEIMLRTPDLRRQFLQDLVDRKLLARQAEAGAVAKSPELQARLTLAREQILAEMYAEAYVEERSTEAHQRDYFKKDPSRFSSKEVRASHILLKSEAEAQVTLDELRKPGGDFDALARAHEGSGDLGFFGRGRMLPEFEAAAFATEKGAVHPTAVKTAFGFHIIKVVDSRGDDKVEFEEVQADVKEALTRELRAELLTAARAGASVKVDEQALRTLSH